VAKSSQQRFSIHSGLPSICAVFATNDFKKPSTQSEQNRQEPFRQHANYSMVKPKPQD
jgi:hypothetical protein